MLGRFFRRGKVRPEFFFPRAKINTGILFPGVILSRGGFSGGSSMRGELYATTPELLDDSNYRELNRKQSSTKEICYHCKYNGVYILVEVSI